MDANDIHAAGNTAQGILGHGVDAPRPRPRPGLLIPGKIVRGEEAVERLADEAVDVDRFPPPSPGLRMLNVIDVSTNDGVSVL